LEEIRKINKVNPNLANKIVLCNNNCMALENIYKNIDQKSEEIIEEKIKNAVIKGSYTFKRDTKGNKCIVLMTYTSNKGQNSYTFNDLQDLHGHALLIAKPTVNLNLSVENK